MQKVRNGILEDEATDHNSPTALPEITSPTKIETHRSENWSNQPEAQTSSTELQKVKIDDCHDDVIEYFDRKSNEIPPTLTGDV